jgi:hypothetical protein
LEKRTRAMKSWWTMRWADADDDIVAVGGANCVRDRVAVEIGGYCCCCGDGERVA